MEGEDEGKTEEAEKVMQTMLLSSREQPDTEVEEAQKTWGAQATFSHGINWFADMKKKLKNM